MMVGHLLSWPLEMRCHIDVQYFGEAENCTQLTHTECYRDVLGDVVAIKFLWPRQ